MNQVKNHKVYNEAIKILVKALHAQYKFPGEYTFKTESGKEKTIETKQWTFSHYCDSLKRVIHFVFKEYVASKDDSEYVMKITNLTSFTLGDSIRIEFCSFNTRNEILSTIVHELTHFEQNVNTKDNSSEDWYRIATSHKDNMSQVDFLLYLLNKREMDVSCNELFTDIVDSSVKTVGEIEKLDTYNRYVIKRHKLYDMCTEPDNKDEVVCQLRDYGISYDKFIRYINRCMYVYDKHVAALIRKYFVEYINESIQRVYKHHVYIRNY